MTIINEITSPKSIPLPHPSNLLRDDVQRLRTALTWINDLIAALDTVVEAKAAAGHTHVIAGVTGLQDALDGKAAAGHTHDLNALTDVDVAAAANNMFLKRVAGVWRGVSLTLAQMPELQGYVDNRIAALVGSSGAALDTLNELADALGDDPNFAATITAALATKIAKTGATDLSGSFRTTGRFLVEGYTPTDNGTNSTNQPAINIQQNCDGWGLRINTHGNSNDSGIWFGPDGSAVVLASNHNGSHVARLFPDGNLNGQRWYDWGGDHFATEAIVNKINQIAVTATRFNGWYDYDMDIAGWHFLPSGWVVTALLRGADGIPYRMGGRQPQVRINGNWYPLGGW